MTDKIDKASREALKTIDDLGSPENMSKKEWVEFLGCLIGDLEARKEAAEQELENEG